MGKTTNKSGITFQPDKYYIEFDALRPQFNKLNVAFDVIATLCDVYGCNIHVGMGKWISVGLLKNKWFGREWRMDVALNYHYFHDGKVFFQLATHWYSRVPIWLDFLVANRKNGYKAIKTYTLEEVQDAALLERDIRAVLDAELVTGKAWEF